MKKLNLTKALLALAIPGLVTLASAAGIRGSAHDWTGAGDTWNVNKDICGPCHMAHGTDPNNQSPPLWSRDLSLTPSGAFTPYQTKAAGGGSYVTVPTPDDGSLACLSCHDGTLAYNQLKGTTIGADRKVLGDYVIGGNKDLRGDHPISFSYASAVTASPTNTLKLPSEILGGAYNAGNNTGGTLPVGHTWDNNSTTVDKAFLKSGKVQCTSCHDVHRSLGDSGLSSDKSTMGDVANHNPLLVVFNGNGRVDQSGVGSSLCRSCHNK